MDYNVLDTVILCFSDEMNWLFSPFIPVPWRKLRIDINSLHVQKVSTFVNILFIAV